MLRTVLITCMLAALSGPALAQRPISQRLFDVIEPVRIEEAPLRAAFDWWRDVTGISLVIDWRALERQGVDPDQPVSLHLRRAPAHKVLALLMNEAAADLDNVQLMYQATPWYVQVQSRRQADQELVVRVYLVHDLVLEVPRFAGPEFDLGAALADGEGPFAQQEVLEARPTAQDRGEALAELIRSTVEPEVWTLAGGPASLRYLRGRLIVRAPRYVHRQIGLPEMALEPDGPPVRALPHPPRGHGGLPEKITGQTNNPPTVSGRDAR